MRKENTKVITLILCLILSSLTSCSFDNNKIEGKYISSFDNSIYYTFSEESEFKTNDSWDFQVNNSEGSYKIENDKLVLYANNNEKYQMNLGIVYKDYICSVWEGVLPVLNKNAEVSWTPIEDLTIRLTFNEDGNYERTVTSNNQTISTEHGTYSVDDNKVICTNEDNVVTTFFDTDDGVLCAEYIKE